jgi:hypothetical protein
MTIKNPIATGVSLIALGIFLLITTHARGQTTNGLTAAQKAQVADPANPQFTPLWQPAVVPEVDDDQTAYFFPDTPSDEVKAWALKRAFQLNGNSMVGNNRMIDLSKETPFSTVVQTEKIAVTTAPVPRPVGQADLNMEDLRKFSRRANMKIDICARNHMHKVVTGSSWRCK